MPGASILAALHLLGASELRSDPPIWSPSSSERSRLRWAVATLQECGGPNRVKVWGARQRLVRALQKATLLFRRRELAPLFSRLFGAFPHAAALGDCTARRCDCVRFYCPARTDKACIRSVPVDREGNALITRGAISRQSQSRWWAGYARKCPGEL